MGFLKPSVPYDLCFFVIAKTLRTFVSISTRSPDPETDSRIPSTLYLSTVVISAQPRPALASCAANTFEHSQQLKGNWFGNDS